MYKLKETYRRGWAWFEPRRLVLLAALLVYLGYEQPLGPPKNLYLSYVAVLIAVMTYVIVFCPNAAVTFLVDYWRKLRAVTESGAWEPWVLYMLRGVEETSLWTSDRIKAIRRPFSWGRSGDGKWSTAIPPCCRH